MLRAILGDESIIKSGSFVVPKREDIGYLDQHYSNVERKLSVFEAVKQRMPSWNAQEVRKFLGIFLFRSNEEVEKLCAHLSGGERARLSLCLIALHPPKLLILDEITNNLDMETKDHVAEIIRDYPSACLVISHEKDFLEAIALDCRYEIINKKLVVQ